VDEIVHTSSNVGNPTVGSKVLGFCIPRLAAERQARTGRSAVLAAKANPEAATFAYFEPGYSELRQHGPTIVCGQYAVTDVVTENDPSRDFQVSQVRILSLPNFST
jgi:hypothetical protein